MAGRKQKVQRCRRCGKPTADLAPASRMCWPCSDAEATALLKEAGASRREIADFLKGR